MIDTLLSPLATNTDTNNNLVTSKLTDKLKALTPDAAAELKDSASKLAVYDCRGGVKPFAHSVCMHGKNLAGETGWFWG